MKNELDKILKDALTPNEEPGFWINENLWRRLREENTMKNKAGTELAVRETKRRRRRKPALLLATVLLVALCSATVFAAWKFLSPGQVAEKAGYQELEKAFEGEDAVYVGETRSEAGFDVTLLGVVSGKNLAGQKMMAGQPIEDNCTYAVVAITHTDGTPMPETSEDAYGEEAFFITPLIRGLNPMEYNSFTMNGGYMDIVEEGVLYRIAECDNVEIFADRGLYLFVQGGTFPDIEAWNFDESLGSITENPDYEGLNILFELPIDKAKGDRAAAEEYLKGMEEAEEEPEEEPTPEEMEVEEFMDMLTPENIDEYCEPVESTRQLLVPDEEGYVKLAGFEVEGRGGMMDGTSQLPEEFLKGEPGMSGQFGYSCGEGLDSLLIFTHTLREDGKVDFVAYIPKS